MDKYARKNSTTGKGINTGWVFNGGEYYCETEKEAKAYVESLKDGNGNFLIWEEEVKTIDTNGEWFCYTEWEEPIEEWYDKQGNIYKKCYRCGEETKINEDFIFCQHCLTHL